MSVRAMTWVWDQTIPPNLKIVLLAIADHADDAGQNAYPSHETLARKTGYSTRQVKRLIEQLVGLGVVTNCGPARLPHLRPDRYPIMYRLHMDVALAVSRDDLPTTTATPAFRADLIDASARTCYWCHMEGSADNGPDGWPWEVDRLTPGREGGSYTPENVVLACRDCNRRVDRMTPRGETRVDTGGATGGHPGSHGWTPVSYEPSLNRPEPSSLFGAAQSTLAADLAGAVEAHREGSEWIEFWRLYPRRVSKARAVEAWRRIAPRDRADVLAGVQAWSAYWTAARTEERFIPHPATWLRGREWENTPDAPTPQPDRPGTREWTDAQGVRRRTDGSWWSDHHGAWIRN